MPLKKLRHLRAIRPGQWTRVVVPDYECWREKGDWREVKPGSLVDICVMPTYGPRYDNWCFEWSYRIAYRRPDCGWNCQCRPDGG
jgi:hypothetical protein